MTAVAPAPESAGSGPAPDLPAGGSGPRRPRGGGGARLLVPVAVTLALLGSAAVPIERALSARAAEAAGTPAGGAVPAEPPAPAPVTAPVTAPAPAPVPVDGPPGARSGWRAVFTDEFDGDTLDPRKWRANRYGGRSLDPPFNRDKEGAYYAPSNVRVSGGEAQLTVQPAPATIGGQHYTHSSGMISSQGRFECQDGDYLEARVRVPVGEGLWPAFWTSPSNRWPPETDVFEFFDTAKQKQPFFVYHYPDLPREAKGWPGDPSVDHTDSWHTYGVLRAHGTVVPYVDGVAYPAMGAAAGADDLGQFIMFDLAVYAGAHPTPGTSMRIDWVRVWRPATG